MHKLFTLILSFICLLSLAVIPAWAAPGDLVIRLEEPKTPTNLNDFEISFVALDILNQEISVQCLKKSSSDADFSVFDSTTLTAGGNSDSCHITSSVFNNNDTYQLKVIATTATDTASDLATIQYNTVGPDTPSEYQKEKVSSCQYKISFKTGNDSGRTVKVEVYRSENTTFTADSGTRVETITIGSNEFKSINNDIPDCNKTYYYAVRAFDSAGNGSGLIGDSEITVIGGTTTTTTVSTASPTSAIPVTEPTGIVLGEEEGQTGESAESSPESTEMVTPTPEVLGERTNRLLLNLGLIVLGIMLIYAVVKTLKKKKQG